MATIQRPLKTYGNRTYVAEVAAAPSNQDPILANEVDGDIDTMYSAWNGGADTVNIKDGAISRVKLSTTDVLPSLPPVPVATDANKTVVVNTTGTDRKSTRLNSSHLGISYAVFCLKKKKQK